MEMSDFAPTISPEPLLGHSSGMNIFPAARPLPPRRISAPTEWEIESRPNGSSPAMPGDIYIYPFAPSPVPRHSRATFIGRLPTQDEGLFFTENRPAAGESGSPRPSGLAPRSPSKLRIPFCFRANGNGSGSRPALKTLIQKDKSVIFVRFVPLVPDFAKKRHSAPFSTIPHLGPEGAAISQFKFLKNFESFLFKISGEISIPFFTKSRLHFSGATNPW